MYICIQATDRSHLAVGLSLPYRSYWLAIFRIYIIYIAGGRVFNLLQRKVLSHTNSRMPNNYQPPIYFVSDNTLALYQLFVLSTPYYLLRYAMICATQFATPAH